MRVAEEGRQRGPVDHSVGREDLAAAALLLLAVLLLVLPGMTLAAGRVGGAGWLVHISIGLAVGFGFLAGLVFRRARGAEGATVPYVLFLAASVFAAVEAHAVGLGIARGAPGVAAALLVPPLAIAAGALWVAAQRMRKAADARDEGEYGRAGRAGHASREA